MKTLKIGKIDNLDLPNISHLPIGVRSRRPGCQAEVKKFRLALSSFLISASKDYNGDVNSTSTKKSQAVLTHSQNSQQLSQNSGEDPRRADNSWQFGSSAAEGHVFLPIVKVSRRRWSNG